MASTATLVLGQPDFTSNGSDTTASTLWCPFGVSVNSSGNVWVADNQNSRVLEYLFGYAASGSITVSGGSSLGGVTLTLSGAASATVSSAIDGTFSFTGLPNGPNTITPSLSGYSFMPASAQVTITNGNATAQNFTATVGGGSAGKPAIYASGGPNGYAEPGRGYNATIHLTSPSQSGHVTVKIYTQRGGMLVATLEAEVTAGTESAIAWNCKNINNETVGSGVYIALINGAGYDDEKLRIGVLK